MRKPNRVYCFACTLWSESSSDVEKAASTETTVKYQQLQSEDNSKECGSSSGSQERTSNEDVHVC